MNETEAAVADALRAHVADVEASPEFLAGVAAREAAHRRQSVVRLAAAAAAAAVVALVVGATVVTRGAAPPSPAAPPAATPTATADGAVPPPPAVRPRYEATWLPPGFGPAQVGTDGEWVPDERGPRTWLETARYAPPTRPGEPPRGVLFVVTMSGEVIPPSADYYRTEAFEPQAKQVRIGSLTVWRVRDHSASGGLIVYQWLAEPGVVVDVTGMAGVPDRDVRRFIAGLRRVS
ncbi:MAG TPA: hypothetical protein VNA20_14765 [Frankiaceae bacterium]|nr:hypothetical protein [Frankiaceae bacterium]